MAAFITGTNTSTALVTGIAPLLGYIPDALARARAWQRVSGS